MTAILSHVFAKTPWTPTAVLLLVFLFSVGWYRPRSRRPAYRDVPIARVPGLSPQDSWMHHPNETVQNSVTALPPDENFQVLTPAGPLLVLRNTYALEAAQHPALSLSAFLRANYFPEYPGFEGVRVGLEGEIHDTMRDTVARRLTQALGDMTPDLIEETRYAFNAVFGNSKDWHIVRPGSQVRELVARVTSRVLVGKRLCRNEKWLAISNEYYLSSAKACASLAAVPAFLRPLLHWFVPSCRKLRSLVRGATELIQNEVHLRSSETPRTASDDDKHRATLDAVTWLYEESSTRGRQLGTPDLVALQLGLAVAAYHTTTLELLHALYKLCEFPDIALSLREEITRVIGGSGWSKRAFAHLLLMDSFLLECRRHSSGPLKLLRIATNDVVLSSGLVIKKGTYVQVLDRNLDPSVYPEPHTFDASRFVALRAQAESQGNKWQFVNTNALQMGFGLGRHACPGRFYAANEMKAILAHLVMGYDVRFDPTYGKLQEKRVDGHAVPDYNARLLCKRREHDVALNAIAAL